MAHMTVRREGDGVMRRRELVEVPQGAMAPRMKGTFASSVRWPGGAGAAVKQHPRRREIGAAGLSVRLDSGAGMTPRVARRRPRPGMAAKLAVVFALAGMALHGQAGGIVDGRGPQRGCAARPASARTGMGTPEPHAGAALAGTAPASLAGGGPPFGITTTPPRRTRRGPGSRPFAPTLPTVQTARPPRVAHLNRAGQPGAAIAAAAPGASSQAGDGLSWNLHAQVTETPQGDAGFPAAYSGANSLNSDGEIQQTLTSDLFFGVRLWSGGELHVDGLLWQGYGLSHTEGIEAYPNGDAYKLGTTTPHFMFAHLFIRETIGLGGEKEHVSDAPLALATEQDVARLTLTIGRLRPTDMFDHNAYAQDAHTQFLNWAMQTNLAWDFPSDSVGYTTGIVAELNQTNWMLRTGWFQTPGTKNGFTADDLVLMFPRQGSSGKFFDAWGSAAEIERRYGSAARPGAIRFLSW